MQTKGFTPSLDISMLHTAAETVARGTKNGWLIICNNQRWGATLICTDGGLVGKLWFIHEALLLEKKGRRVLCAVAE